MSKTESGWLGGAQAAAYLGVTPMTIWRWAHDPKLAFPASTVIHGRKYWSRDDIDAWMRSMAISSCFSRSSIPTASTESFATASTRWIAPTSFAAW